MKYLPLKVTTALAATAAAVFVAGYPYEPSVPAVEKSGTTVVSDGNGKVTLVLIKTPRARSSVNYHDGRPWCKTRFDLKSKVNTSTYLRPDGTIEQILKKRMASIGNESSIRTMYSTNGKPIQTI